MKPSSEVGLLVQNTIYACLDAVCAAIPLDLCAYLHAAGDTGPQLYLRAPELSSLDANEAFELFGALRDTVHAAPGDESDLTLGGYTAVAVATVGSRSHGVHVLGRREHALLADQRDLAVRLCRSLGQTCHLLEATAEPDVDALPVRVAVESDGETAKAEVSVPVAGSLRTGWGSGPSAMVAVAQAVVDAVSPGLEVRHAGEGDAGGESAVLVLVADRDRRGLGCALASNDPLRAVASAALDAIARLRAGQ